MKHSVMILFMLLALDSQAQKEYVIGVLSSSNEEIKAKTQVFSNRIHEFYFDPASKLLSVRLRGPKEEGGELSHIGRFILYDWDYGHIKWTTKIDYRRDRDLQFDTTLIRTTPDKSFGIHLKSGKKIWKIKHEIILVDSMHNLGVRYNENASPILDYMLEGIDLSNGKVIWQRYVNAEYGWNDYFNLNDSTLAIISSGIYAINLYTGTCWEYQAITGKWTREIDPMATAVDAVTGSLGFVFLKRANFLNEEISPNLRQVLLVGMASNLLVDKTGYFFASMKNIARINKEGKTIWSTALPEEKMSSSEVFTHHGKLFLINKGLAISGKYVCAVGIPFLAAFDTDTGEQIFYEVVDGPNSHSILDVKINGNYIFFLDKQKMQKFSLENGKRSASMELTLSANNELTEMLGDEVFVLNDDSLFENINLSDPDKINVLTKRGEVISLDQNLKVVHKYQPENLWTMSLETSTFTFISRSTKTLILDKKNRKLAEFIRLDNIKLIGTKLYATHGDAFFEVDLRKLFTD